MLLVSTEEGESQHCDSVIKMSLKTYLTNLNLKTTHFNLEQASTFATQLTTREWDILKVSIHIEMLSINYYANTPINVDEPSG